MLDNYIKLLGRVVCDRVTHFEGTITNVTFDLYGCIQAAVQPPVDKDGKLPDGRWMDVHRLEPKGDDRGAPTPDFGPDAPTIEVLGRWGRDCVTHFEGTVSSVAFPLAGRAEIALTPRVDKDGKHQEGKWFDAKRVSMIEDQRQMPPPKFAETPTVVAAHPRDHAHGPAEKPAPEQGPPI